MTVYDLGQGDFLITQHRPFSSANVLLPQTSLLSAERHQHPTFTFLSWNLSFAWGSLTLSCMWGSHGMHVIKFGYFLAHLSHVELTARPAGGTEEGKGTLPPTTQQELKTTQVTPDRKELSQDTGGQRPGPASYTLGEKLRSNKDRLWVILCKFILWALSNS